MISKNSFFLDAIAVGNGITQKGLLNRRSAGGVITLSYSKILLSFLKYAPTKMRLQLLKI